MSSDKDNKNTGGTRFAHSAPEEHGRGKNSSFAELFIPSAEDDTPVKIRKIAVIAAVVLLVGILIYFVVSLGSADDGSGGLTNTPDDASPETLVITSETTAAETTTVPTEATAEETTTTAPPAPLVMREDIKSLYDSNNDTAGWIKIDGTAVNSVVVQGEDNDFYLNHDFYGNPKQAGFLYIDYRCVVNDYDFNQSDNITVYGHNQKDGSMFGTLQYYKVTSKDSSRFSFYKDHPTFTFSNLYEDYTYKIVAMFVSEATKSQAKDGEIFDPHNFVIFRRDPAEKRSFENFVKNINERTEILTGVDMQKGDKFMTLSTCSNEFENSRFIVIGRRLRDGESAEVDTSAAVLNPDVKEPDLHFIYYGN